MSPRLVIACFVSLAKHFTLIVPSFTQEDKLSQPNLKLGITLPWTGIMSGVNRNIPSCFMLQKAAKGELQPDRPFLSNAVFTKNVQFLSGALIACELWLIMVQINEM